MGPNGWETGESDSLFYSWITPWIWIIFPFHLPSIYLCFYDDICENKHLKNDGWQITWWKNRIKMVHWFFKKLIFWEKIESNLYEKRLGMVTHIKVSVYLLYFSSKLFGYSCLFATSHYFENQFFKCHEKKKTVWIFNWNFIEIIHKFGGNWYLYIIDILLNLAI